MWWWLGSRYEWWVVQVWCWQASRYGWWVVQVGIRGKPAGMNGGWCRCGAGKPVGMNGGWCRLESVVAGAVSVLASPPVRMAVGSV